MKDYSAFSKERFNMKNYVEPELDIMEIEYDIITQSFSLPIL